MNINNLTIKAQEVLQSAMNLARSDRNQAVEPLHMLDAIVAEDDSVGVFLLQKLGVNVGARCSVLRQQVERLPKVEGGEVYFSRESSEAIQKAGDFTKTFGDKYASVEHLLLGILTERSEASRLLKDAERPKRSWSPQSKSCAKARRSTARPASRSTTRWASTRST